jgi:hypothetical protein
MGVVIVRNLETAEDKLVRIEISLYLWTICEEVAKLLRTTPKGALHQLLVSVTEGLEQGQIGVLPYTWERARISLKRQGLLGVNDPTPIDISKLHQNAKTKSGFEGVYPNGAKGFSARGKNPSGPGQIYLGTFPTTEEAAWARYTHYKKHNLPYGDLEEAVNDFRENVPQMAHLTDAQVEHYVIHEAATLPGKKPLKNLTPEQRALEKIDPSKN